jgi:hypothetical protein
MRTRRFRAAAHRLSEDAFQRRKTFFIQGESGLLVQEQQQQPAQENPMASMANNPLMDQGSMMSMMGKNFATVISNILLFTWIDRSFSGFISGTCLLVYIACLSVLRGADPSLCSQIAVWIDARLQDNVSKWNRFALAGCVVCEFNVMVYSQRDGTSGNPGSHSRSSWCVQHSKDIHWIFFSLICEFAFRFCCLQLWMTLRCKCQECRCRSNRPSSLPLPRCMLLKRSSSSFSNINGI